MMRRRWSALLLLLVLLCGGALVAVPTGRAARAAAPALGESLTIEAPPTAPVGAALAVRVRGALPDGAVVTLVAIGTWGPQAYRATASGGGASFTLPAEDTRKAGVVSLAATAGDARGRGQLTLLAGAAVEPSLPLVGPRSIVADSQDWTMVTVVPADRFGNPLADDTPVRLRARHGDGTTEDRTMPIRHLLAWARIDSRTHAGKGAITVTTTGIPGPEAAFLEVPGWPVALAVAADPPTLAADGRQLTTLQTGILRDKFDNVVADGTAIAFVVDLPGGERRTIAASTIGGIARAPLRAPTEPGVATVRATIYGAESAPLRVAFTPGPATGTFPLAASVDAAQKNLVIQGGPLVGEFGGYAPDGTTVLVRLTDGQGRVIWLTTQVAGGQVRLTVRLATLATGEYRIEAFAGSGQGATKVNMP